MRASTLFAVTIAILLGLAAAITVKITGYLGQPAVVAAARLPEINVVVPARIIFKGTLIDAPYVRVRQLRAEEVKDYENNKDKYLPGVPGATSLRIAAKTLDVDGPIMKDDLEVAALPQPLSTLLLPNMRAVDISVGKEQSAGGLIQTGEWVDVLFTTQITANGVSSTRTAAIAHKQRVVAKRNSLFPVIGPLPDDKLVHYTIEMNPYRAALVSYCKTRGVLSLVPVSSAEQKTMEEAREAALKAKEMGEKFEAVNFVELAVEESQDKADEADRVDAINKGEINIGTQDLVRIFGIQTPPPPLSKELPISVEQFVANRRITSAQFNKDGTPYENFNAGQSGYGYGLVRDPVNGKLVAAPKPLPTRQGALGAGAAAAIDITMPELQFGMPKEKGCKNCKDKMNKSAAPPVAPEEE